MDTFLYFFMSFDLILCLFMSFCSVFNASRAELLLPLKGNSLVTLRVKAQSFIVTQVLSIFLLFLLFFRLFLNGYNF